MGLLSRFRTANRQPQSQGGRESAGDADSFVQETRVRVRRRLIGAALLLGAGVIAFPLLFETQPRPVPVDVALDIPDAGKTPPLTLPRAASVTPPDAPVIKPVAPLPPEPKAQPQTQPEPRPEAGPQPRAQSQADEPRPASPAPRPADAVVSSTDARTPPKAAAQREPAKDATKDAAKDPAKETPADAGRFVVQVGAFAENDSARAARRKVEAMGLKTYTQEVNTDGGKRIRVRVGPYASRAEAQKAAERIKAGGLPAALLAL